MVVQPTFDERAQEFLRAIGRGEGCTSLQRDIGVDVRELLVGTGPYEGLVFKHASHPHAMQALNYYETFTEYYHARGYDPYSYTLQKPDLVFIHAGGVIQTYYPEPTWSELQGYFVFLRAKQRQENGSKEKLDDEEQSFLQGRYMASKEALSRCQALLARDSNKDLTLDAIREIGREFSTDKDALDAFVKGENLIALGQQGNPPKMGLVIIDY